jgi:hypothetical protein
MAPMSSGTGSARPGATSAQGAPAARRPIRSGPLVIDLADWRRWLRTKHRDDRAIGVPSLPGEADLATREQLRELAARPSLAQRQGH